MAPKRKPLNEATKTALKTKAKNSRFTYEQLEKVYRRGQGAYLAGRIAQRVDGGLGYGPGQQLCDW